MRVLLTAVITTALTLIAPPAHAGPTASTITWQPCTDTALHEAGMECATLTVPELRTKPNGATVRLALVRHPSTGSAEERIGSLVFNPGGPGGSGTGAITWAWANVPDPIRRRFDLVSWDPRGVGATVPHLDPDHCRAPRPARPATGPVNWSRVVRSYERELAGINRACQASYKGDPSSISTMQNVADLEAIRRSLGEGPLNFWGMSYGTRIGYVYALQHPDQVRTMVLDGSIDPASTLLDLTEGAAAADQAYGAFAAAYPDAARGLEELLATLNTRSVRLADDERLTRWTVIDAVYDAVGQQGAYPGLARAIDIWHRAVFTSGAARTDAVAQATALGQALAGAFNSNASYAFSLTNCADYADRPTTTQVAAQVRRQHRLAPRLGATQATMYGLGCAGLTTEPDPIPRITGAGSPVPVLILGSTRDGSTIVQWTARMSRAFPNSRTVTYAGGQHVVWGIAGSSCVDDVADAYVIDRVLPSADVGCSNAVRPSTP